MRFPRENACLQHNCNTTEFYAALGDTAGSMTAEADTVALMGEVVVQVDADGNLARSQTFSITGLNRVVTGSEGVPVSANPAYPSAAAVIAAVAQAAAASTYVEQTWDGTANVAVNAATTVLRLTTGTPGTQHTITLPASPANGQALEIVVPPSTGTPAIDPGTGGAVQFKVAPANLSIAADPTYTRVYRLIAGTGGWAVDQSLVRQNTSARFTGVSTSQADFSGDVAFEDGTTIHGSQGTAFGFSVLGVNGAAQFTPVPLAPGQTPRLNAAGTALEAFVAAQRVPVPANSSAAGGAGQWSGDDTYLYYYGATKWLRVAGSTF